MVKIVRMKEYDEGLAGEMGALLKDLVPDYDGAAVSLDWLREVVSSPYYEQLLAYDGDELVGMATVSVVFGSYIGKKVWLEDFVVRADQQGRGVGGLIWQGILAWGREQGAKCLEFTSSKQGAIGFYLKKGAAIRETNCFRMGL